MLHMQMRMLIRQEQLSRKITKEGNDGENYTFNITNLNVPDGYELVTATWEKSVAYGDEEFVNVTVKKERS